MGSERLRRLNPIFILKDAGDDQRERFQGADPLVGVRVAVDFGDRSRVVVQVAPSVGPIDIVEKDEWEGCLVGGALELDDF